MTKEEDALFVLLEAFLDECDACLDRKADSKCIWNARINRAMDAVFRQESGIPPAPRIGRPPKEEVRLNGTTQKTDG